MLSSLAKHIHHFNKIFRIALHSIEVIILLFGFSLSISFYSMNMGKWISKQLSKHGWFINYS